jgi:hypothetical protein
LQALKATVGSGRQLVKQTAGSRQVGTWSRRQLVK